jgi:cell division protein FtsI/penicillin-binding protein 2
VAECRAAEIVLARYGHAEGYFPGALPSGGFVAMDANTGEVVAWGEMPRFDLGADLADLFDEAAAGATRDEVSGTWRPGGDLPTSETLEAFHARLSKPAALHLSRVAQIAVEPGSTLKTLIGLGMLESGLGLPYDVFVCGGRRITPGCHVHGAVGFEEALATSCNRYFALSLRDHVGHWPTYRHTIGALLHELGLGRTTEVDIAREDPGTWLRDWVDFDPRIEVRRAVAAVGEALGDRGVTIRHEFRPGIPTRVAGRSASRLYEALVDVLTPLATAAAPGRVLIRVGGARAEERWVDLHAEIRFQRDGGWDAEHRVDTARLEFALRQVGAGPEVQVFEDGSASVAFTLGYHDPIGREAGDPPLILPDDGRNVAIGQGPVQVTPLQMVRAMAVLANGGRLVTPRVALSADGVELRTPPPVDLGLHPSSLARVREGMRRVVGHGTAASAGWGAVRATVYGKTGTAQTGRWWRPGQQAEEGPWHHWFVGFAEAPHDRTLAFACVLHSRTEQAAGRTAVHAAKDFLRWWYDGRKGGP